jgi:hypothetical protein
MRKILLISILSLLTQLTHAAICFNQGNYAGAGMFKDSSGNIKTYEHNATIKSATLVESLFKWPEQEVSLNYEIRGEKIYVNQNPVAAGSIDCRMGSTSLNLTNSNMNLTEEWVFVGNYLLISGQKTVSGQTFKYTELLIKQ